LTGYTLPDGGLRVRTLLLCVVLILTAYPGHVLAQERLANRPAGVEVDLRPRFTNGQVVRLKMILDSRQSGSEGSGSNTSIRQEIGLTLRCTDADPEKGCTLDLIYDSLKASIHTPVADVEFDSTRPASPDDPYDAILRPLVGWKQEVVMDRAGNITSTRTPTSPGDPASILAGKFNATEIFRSIFGPITTARKGTGKATVGEKWTTESSIEGLTGTMRIEMTHTLASHSGGRAVINSTGKVTLEPSSGGLQARISDSTITGRTVWDTDAGMLMESESNQRLVVQTRTDGKTETMTQEMRVQVTREPSRR
jgi:hypothetical protein